MALTINTHPGEVITNAPEFNVTTSLVKDSDHQDLRIRATIYQGGVSSPVAVFEQAKGLDDWNLFDLLKSLTGKCDVVAGGTLHHTSPNKSVEKLTGWTDLLSTFETFTTLGRELTSVIDSNASGGVARGNDMGALSVGDIIIVGLEDDYNDSGVADFVLKLSGNVGLDLQSQVNYAGLSSDKLINNHIYPLMVIESLTTSYAILQTLAGSNAALTGTLTVHQITDFRNNPGVYFMVKFEEVYENASDVTTIGAESWSDTLLFVPVAMRPGEDFTDYVINSADDKLLSRADNISPFYKFGVDMELRVWFISTDVYIRIRVAIDANPDYASGVVANAGWGMFILGDASFPVAVTDETLGLRVSAVDSGGSTYYSSETRVVACELNCFPDIKVLSFIGALGEETIVFRGLPSEAGGAEKSFIKDQNRIRKVLKAYKRTGEVLRTLFETEGIRRLLHELVYAELPVWMYDADFDDGFREVTVISDETAIENQKQLIESEIEVEYYE